MHEHDKAFRSFFLSDRFREKEFAFIYFLSMTGMTCSWTLCLCFQTGCLKNPLKRSAHNALAETDKAGIWGIVFLITRKTRKETQMNFHFQRGETCSPQGGENESRFTLGC